MFLFLVGEFNSKKYYFLFIRSSLAFYPKKKIILYSFKKGPTEHELVVFKLVNPIDVISGTSKGRIIGGLVGGVMVIKKIEEDFMKDSTRKLVWCFYITRLENADGAHAAKQLLSATRVRILYPKNQCFIAEKNSVFNKSENFGWYLHKNLAIFLFLPVAIGTFVGEKLFCQNPQFFLGKKMLKQIC